MKRRKNRKKEGTLKRIVRWTLNIGAVFILVVTSYSAYIFYKAYSMAIDPSIAALEHTHVSSILDAQGEEVKLLGIPDEEEARFEDLPDVFIYALISAEDKRFFAHDGYDITRLVASAVKNITQMRFAQGASTLTQQLIKNKKLTNEKSLGRKIQELILAVRLESMLSKEEIFMLYVNQILFDGVKPGINHAAKKFFSKSINEVTLPEAALLAALVKSPTIYNPLTKPANAQERKNLILQMMADNRFISQTTCHRAQRMEIAQIVNPFVYQTTFEYQSYFDLVLEEVEELTGNNPYHQAMVIETYLDVNLQTQIDLLQENGSPDIYFNDDLMQVGGVVLDNREHAVIGVIGGRNYQGERLFNRAFSMRQQPASTIKPLLSYALALEHLGWSNEHPVSDIPYYYPGTDQEVRNADRAHLGELTIEQAIGYSRNTSALITLEQVIDRIGVGGVASYLERINLLDVPANQFSMAYGLGAMTYGVSPLDLAAAYQMVANGGVYRRPTTIKSITIIESGQVIRPDYQSIQVLSKETTFMLSKVLEGVISKNYWGIGAIEIAGVATHGKTGTSSFDGELLERLGYPANASKDIWIAGYTPDYTSVVWGGFDVHEAGKATYFASSDTRKSIPRKIFQTLMASLPVKTAKYTAPSTLVRQRIIKGYLPYTLANQQVREEFVSYAYFPSSQVLPTELPVPTMPLLPEIHSEVIGDLLNVDFWPLAIEEETNKIFKFSNLYGDLGYVVEVTSPLGETEVIKSLTPNVSLFLLEPGEYQIRGYYQYFESDLKSNQVEALVIRP